MDALECTVLGNVPTGCTELDAELLGSSRNRIVLVQLDARPQSTRFGQVPGARAFEPNRFHALITGTPFRVI